MDLTDKITELEELQKVLGYQDERSVLRWCKQHNIPIIKLGLKKYFSSHFLTQIIDNQIVTFGSGYQTAQIKTRSQKKFDNQNEIVAKYLRKYDKGNHPEAT